VLASVVLAQIVSALDRLLWQEKTAGVRDLLRRVDTDPYRDAVRDAVLAEDNAKVADLARRKDALDQPPGFVAVLGASAAISVERRRQLLQAAVGQRSGDLGLLMTLGGSYPFEEKESADERLRWFQAALAVAPVNNAAHNNLAIALADKGQVDAAIACLRKAIELDPKAAKAHSNLGAYLCDIKRDYDGAIVCFRTAIELEPENALVHYNLGCALSGKDRVEEAITCYQKAIVLDPKFAKAHYKLAMTLSGKGGVEEAIAHLREVIAIDPKRADAHFHLGAILCDFKRDFDGAIGSFTKVLELNPKDAGTHYSLGNAMYGKGQLDEAIARFRKAIELDPKHASSHANLGGALTDKGKLDEAIAWLRKAIELAPKDPKAHYNLGNVLKDKGQVDEAIACYQKAIEINPKYADANCNLGNALANQGRFAESLAAYQRGHELGMKKPGWRYPSAEWVRQAKRMAGLEAKLPAFLKGEFQPRDNAERLGLVGVCQAKKLHHAATRLYADAFAADPKLADDRRAQHRYNAACDAALAAAGEGEDSVKLDAAAKTKLRRQALDWLNAEVSTWSKLLDSAPPQARAAMVQILSHWQKDGDLAGMRDQDALRKLPADERAACARLWADVAALLKKAQP
jgi:tetratricopeptide (TPR) repeat protein